VQSRDANAGPVSNTQPAPLSGKHLGRVNVDLQARQTRGRCAPARVDVDTTDSHIDRMNLIWHGIRDYCDHRIRMGSRFSRCGKRIVIVPCKKAERISGSGIRRRAIDEKPEQAGVALGQSEIL